MRVKQGLKRIALQIKTKTPHKNLDVWRKDGFIEKEGVKIKQGSITNFKISHTFQCRSDSFFNEKLCNCVAHQDTTTQVTKSTLQVYSVQQSKIQEPFK